MIFFAFWKLLSWIQLHYSSFSFALCTLGVLYKVITYINVLESLTGFRAYPGAVDPSSFSQMVRGRGSGPYAQHTTSHIYVWFPQHLVLNAIFSITYVLSTSVQNQLAVCMWINLYGCELISRFSMCQFSRQYHAANYCNLVVCFEIWYYDTPLDFPPSGML